MILSQEPLQITLDDPLVSRDPSIFSKAHAFMAPGAFVPSVIKSGLYAYFRVIGEPEGARAIVEGRKVIMAGSNNYLGLTSDPRVKEAAAQAVYEYGTGCTGSRFLNGTLDIHLELEERLANLMQKEACVLFSTGYMTNMGAIQGITDKNSLIFSDKDNHQCIVAGTQVSPAITWRYRHDDTRHLRRLLQKAEEEHPEKDKLIVSDGVFSMSGRIASVPELADLAAEFDAALILDDAHAVGVIGPGGQGSAAYFGRSDDVHLTTGTFSKSFSSAGGFLVGDHNVIEYIRHMASVHIFSASMPASSVATVLKCLDILEEEPWRLERLWQISDYMREGFKHAGFNVWTSEAPIIPVVIGNKMQTAFQFWYDLLDEGVFVNPVVPWRGAVPNGQSIMRTSYMATHTDDDLDQILEAFRRVGHRHGVVNNGTI